MRRIFCFKSVFFVLYMYLQWCSEDCQNMGDLHSILCLNILCVVTVKLLPLLYSTDFVDIA